MDAIVLNADAILTPVKWNFNEEGKRLDRRGRTDTQVNDATKESLSRYTSQEMLVDRSLFNTSITIKERQIRADHSKKEFAEMPLTWHPQKAHPKPIGENNK